MRDIDRALADITSIRNHLAAGTLFRGFGPAVMAITGGLAFATALAQMVWPVALAGDPMTFFLCWVVTATVSGVLVGAEMVARSRRHHAGLADAMILNAIGQFIPAGLAGAAIAAVLLRYAPETHWLLPGLWQLLVAVGILASLRSLPRAVVAVGAWYFIAGVAVLILASASRSVSPWMMGAPFAAGQLLMAVILHRASGGSHAEG